MLALQSHPLLQLLLNTLLEILARTIRQEEKKMGHSNWKRENPTVN
jgi:hypothetical protein